MGPLRFRSCSIDLDSGAVQGLAGRRASLTARELEVLRFFVARPGDIIPRDQLLTEVWGYSPQVVSRAPDTTIRRLRRKLEDDPAQPDHLLTVFGRGYTLVQQHHEVRSATEDSVLVGRDAEQIALAAAVREAGITTLIGPPGIGKTALARNTLATATCPGRFVDLIEARGAEDVVTAIARACGLSLQRRKKALDQVSHAIADAGPLLLVLDNCEQVHGVTAKITSTLIARAPTLHVVATSRIGLGIPSERLFPVTPLDPESAKLLFVTLARRARPDVALDGPVQEVVAQLVERLERLPLAIALAAGRIGALSPSHILQRLDERFRLLRSQARDVSPRHRTLFAAVDWSYDLLAPREQRVLLQCAAFRGGFDADAARAVVEEDDVIGVLTSLCSQSLLEQRGRRYAGYAFIREYAEARLAEADGLQHATWTRHADHYATRWRHLGHEDRPQLLGPDRYNLKVAAERALRLGRADLAAETSLGYLDVLGREGPMDDVQPVLEAVLATEGLDPALELALIHRHVYTQLRSGITDVAARLARAEAIVDTHPDLRHLGSMLRLRGRISRHRGRYVEAEADLRRAMDLARQAGDTDALCDSLVKLGLLLRDLGRFEEARGVYEALKEIAEEIGGTSHLISCVTSLAGLHRRAGRFEEAQQHYAQGLALAIEIESPYAQAQAHLGLGNLALELGDPAEADASYRRGLVLAQRMGWRQTQGQLHGNLALVAQIRGDLEGSIAASERALEVFEALDSPREAAMARAHLGDVALQQGKLDRAEVLLSRACRTVAALGDHATEASYLGPLAEVAWVRGDLDTAAAHLRTAEVRARHLGDPLLLAQVLARRGLVEIARGEPGSATLAEAEGLLPDADADSQATRLVDRLRAAVSAP